MSGITSFLVGGDQEYNPTHGNLSNDEKGILKDVNSGYSNLGNSANVTDQESTAAFKQHLMDFLNHSNGPNPTQDQVDQATKFVDQTFTNSANTALDQYSNQFQAQQKAKAAAMGRNANLDPSTQQGIYDENARNTAALQAQRGSQIASTAQNLNNQTYQQNLGTLQAGMTGSGFLSDLLNRSYANRLNLLNSRTGGQLGYYQNDRSQTPGGTSSGLLTNATSIVGAGSNFVNSVGGFGQGQSDKMIGQATGLMGAAGGSGGGAGGMMSMFSDARLKTKIADASKDIFDFLKSLNPYSYLYKNQNHGAGKTYSVMAQDLEKSEVGKTLVFETPTGKAIDYTKAFAVMLASQAALLKRIEQLEHR